MDILIDAQEGAHAQKFDRLESGVVYRVRFRDFNGLGEDEFMDILHLAGHWWSPNDGDTGPLTVQEAGYEVVAMVGRPVDLGAALREVLPSAAKPA